MPKRNDNIKDIKQAVTPMHEYFERRKGMDKQEVSGCKNQPQIPRMILRVKTIILQTQDGDTLDVLTVINHDNEFAERLFGHIHGWQESSEDEFSNYVYKRLREDGYVFESVNYETIDTGI